ncbi:DUF937 domain-containing protein [Weeksellaceae bacterium TAE3-ERU29]|nr:DUF937 domain-containing protein [Weeksellaceae bacterium TAE3-ERU29]
MNIQNLLTGTIGNQLIGNLSKQLGVEDSKVSSAVSMAVPFILGQMNKNAQTPQGAESLDKALNKHSNSSILDNISGLLGGVNSSEGLGILGHVFGGKQEQVAENIGNKSALSSGNVMQILTVLAPILMNFLGKQKQQKNVGTDGLSGLLSGVLGGDGNSSSGFMGMAEKMLDKNGDGNISDDVMNMGSDLLKGLFKK